jgi:formiminotetrahydrofolate cyclodeaminase
MDEQTTLTGFLDVLASAAPVPGGGGASAVAGALAASLGQMVANLTSGKKKYADVQPRIDQIIPELEALRAQLLDLVQADADAFEPLSRAYGLPRATEEERAHKAEVMEGALRVACEPPYQIMETICEAIDVLEELSVIGTRIAISDVGVGAAFCSAALKGASLNVFINAKSMTDREYADELVARTQALLDDGCAKADETFKKVERGIRWGK